MAVTANAEKIAKLSALGIAIPSLSSGARLHPLMRIEPPAQVTKVIRWDTAVQIGAFSMLHGPGDIVAASIGRYCSFAPGVVIGSNEHAMSWLSTSSLLENPKLYDWHRRSPCAGDFSNLKENCYKESLRPIKIGHDVWIGQNSFVRGGVVIGDGAVIGSMSNVVTDVPPYSIFAGNPARLVRYRFDHDKIVSLINVQWWRFSIFDLLPFDLTDLRCLEAIDRAEKSGELHEYTPNVIDSAWLS
jgi:acetyltransferase-like isoleucine patch superfamily enzyme